jgi:PleD family two-component response regulator
VDLQVEEAPANGLASLMQPPPRTSPASDLADQLYCPTEVQILVIDDEEPVCMLIQRSLTRPNFRVDSISQPDKIEAQLQARKYHLIILDYNIPGLKAEKLFDWFQSHQRDASVIVVTGYPSVDSVVTCLRARTFDYLTKPFDMHQLEAVVRRCLETKGLLRLSEEALRETLGNVIRERRKALGFTLAEMATRTNVSLGYLSQIELGKNSASIETLYRICLGLGLKMADLFQTIKT